MAGLLEFEESKGGKKGPCFINPDRVCAVLSEGTNTSRVIFDNSSVIIKGEPKDIVFRLGLVCVEVPPPQPV